jgi:hypothetical protein
MVSGINQSSISSEPSQLDHPDSGPCNSQILRRVSTMGQCVHSTVRHGHPTDTTESVEVSTRMPGSCALGRRRSRVTSLSKVQSNHHQRRDRSVASVQKTVSHYLISFDGHPILLTETFGYKHTSMSYQDHNTTTKVSRWLPRMTHTTEQ